MIQPWWLHYRPPADVHLHMHTRAPQPQRQSEEEEGLEGQLKGLLGPAAGSSSLCSWTMRCPYAYIIDARACTSAYTHARLLWPWGLFSHAPCGTAGLTTLLCPKVRVGLSVHTFLGWLAQQQLRQLFFFFTFFFFFIPPLVSSVSVGV